MVNIEKSELEPKQIFKFVGYQYNLRGQGQTHLGTLADSRLKDSGTSHRPLLSDQATHVAHWRIKE